MMRRPRAYVIAPILALCGSRASVAQRCPNLDVDNAAAAAALIDADPAISSGLGRFELHPMDAIVRGHDAAAS
jgi:hypothetical protein